MRESVLEVCKFGKMSTPKLSIDIGMLVNSMSASPYKRMYKKKVKHDFYK